MDERLCGMNCIVHDDRVVVRVRLGGRVLGDAAKKAGLETARPRNASAKADRT
jgi:hypothetical protein